MRKATVSGAIFLTGDSTTSSSSSMASTALKEWNWERGTLTDEFVWWGQYWKNRTLN